MVDLRAPDSKSASDDAIPPFLRPAAPPWAAGGLAWAVLLMAIAAGVAAAVIRIPEIVSSGFLLVPARGGDPVRAARTGRVTEVRVAEGAIVGAGQTLFVIRSATVGDQSAELTALEGQLRGALAARDNAREKHESSRRADAEHARGLAERHAHIIDRMANHRALRVSREARYQTSLRMAEAEEAGARAEIAFKREHHALAREIARRHQWGYEADFLSWSEYMQAYIEASKTGVDLEQLQRVLDIASLKIAQLRAEHAAEETEWAVVMTQLESERGEIEVATEALRHESGMRAAEYRELDRELLEKAEEATIRIAALRGALADARGDRFSVLAPCAGPVVRLAVKRRDAIVQEGEVLSEVACSGERLQAELLVPPSGIGKIKVGQAVKLRYEAFQYQRYGVRHAIVSWIGSMVVPAGSRLPIEADAAALGASGGSGPAFRVRADLVEQGITIDGRRRPLLAGMGGRADIVVDRRSLASFAFEPLRQLKENLAGEPGR